MKLVIVESPAKAKTIEKYLGTGFTVRASVGHIRDLPKSNKDAVDIEGGFLPRYQIVAEKKKVIDELQHESKKADEVILAPVFRATLPEDQRLSVPRLVADLRRAGQPARELALDAIVQTIVDEHRPGDLVVVMSNGGFGGIHRKLIAALQ